MTGPELEQMDPYWRNRYESALMAENGAANARAEDLKWMNDMNRHVGH